VSASRTIIAALKFQSGVVIAADSQASDIVAGVRWPVEKLDCVGGHPCVAGFSGSIANSQKARSKLEATTLHPNMFKKRDKIRDAVDRCLSPIYQQIKKANDITKRDIYRTSLWGLIVFWAEEAPQILECVINGDLEFHPFFQAIGSGANTAHAIYRTLGGERLSSLDERKALLVMLRILRTCVNVELLGVSEPFSVWVISKNKARKISPDEIQPILQFVNRWEEDDRTRFINEM
jgi:20S proteasome alpha/beta subunit